MNVARGCVASLADAGCVLPSWFELVDGVRPPVPEDTGDPFQPRQGWQHFASNIVEEVHLRVALPPVCCGSVPGRTTLIKTVHVARFHDSPSSRPSLSVCCSVVSTCPSPVWPSTRLPLARLQGCWGGVGSPSRAIARICREGVARVSMNVFVRDLDLGPFNHLDGRRLEVVADELSLFGGAQFAIDTTLVSALRRDGTAREGAANRNGVAIWSTRKEITCPELAGAGDVFGWSSLPARLEGVGHQRLRTSCGLWQLRRLGTFPTYCKPASSLLPILRGNGTARRGGAVTDVARGSWRGGGR